MRYKFICYLLICSFLTLTGCSKQNTGYFQEEPVQIDISENIEEIEEPMQNIETAGDE